MLQSRNFPPPPPTKITTFTVLVLIIQIVYNYLFHSAGELIKHSQRANKSLPQRGGHKDFSPDDGWLQAKRLEKFLEERNECLSEERVERLGSLVQGEWVPEKQLVELHKEMGKFWAQMGFVDEKRMWLYPEEALYLMESNILEVWYRGLPVSIQQAYVAFLNTDMSDDEYQVYAHLRRLGYVVIRHQGKLPFTRYERQIGLDKHIKVKSRKRTKQKQGNDVKTSCKKMKTEPVEVEVYLPGQAGTKAESKDGNCDIEENGRDKFHKLHRTKGNVLIHEKGDDIVIQEQQNLSVEMEYKIHQDDDSGCKWGSYDNCRYQLHYESKTKHSSWDFDSINLPNIASLKIVEMEKPSAHLLPAGVDPPKEKYRFDVNHYFRSRSKEKRSSNRYNNEEDSIYELDFSYAEMIRKQRSVQASNWSEYKVKIRHVDENSVLVSPASHYFDEKVPPLLQPEDAWSTNYQHVFLLSRLKIPQLDIQKVSFDVYLPNAKFKKSRPGVPNHRVIVNR
ncbi:hypothetical protein FSP39_014356 [Pinctada imbricata]|uniref:tRNA-splicing endonuclease subunit Sen54 N-terminal domain-containing protein n=1 Tax=Pinctada imbricata TaxID=66713 RepID=A0AA88XZ03_PINIB|nr:hypothetical protein FSP39_014356 [Pinctada imbricata]